MILGMEKGLLHWRMLEDALGGMLETVACRSLQQAILKRRVK
jgi:hypothetical protein